MDILTNYLRDIATLECQVNTQDRLIAQLNQRAHKLGRPNTYREPVLETEYESNTFLAVIISFIIGFAVWWLLFMILPPDGSMKHLSSSIRTFILSLPLWWWIPLVFLPFMAVNRALQRRYNQKYYKKQLADYNETLKRDRQRVNRELVIKGELKNQVNQVQQMKRNTLTSLDQLYSLNIIHPKYRNFVAISSFYDYFDTKRCVSLTGPGGAYATFEQDKMLGSIITQLDTINRKLDDIITNQQCICDLLREANSTLYRIDQKNNQIAQSMNRVEANSELTAYNTHCAAQSAAVMERIAVYYTLKDQ